MNSRWMFLIQGLPTFGSTAVVIVQLGAGVISMVQLVATAIAVVASSLCLGGQLFDHLHDAGITEDDVS